jgi:hypothetical protein
VMKHKHSTLQQTKSINNSPFLTMKKAN